MTRKKSVLTVFILIAALIAIFPIICDQYPVGTHVMQLVRESADLYAAKNGRCAKSYRDLLPFFPGGDQKVGGRVGTLPEKPFEPEPFLSLQERTGNPGYLLDLPQSVVLELLNRNTSSLEKVRKSGCIGYGATAELKRFVIVAFHGNELHGMPVASNQSIIIMSDHGGEQCVIMWHPQKWPDTGDTKSNGNE